jgi:hypothetical protein
MDARLVSGISCHKKMHTPDRTPETTTLHKPIHFVSLPGESILTEKYRKRIEKVSDKKRSFCGFFAAVGKRE